MLGGRAYGHVKCDQRKDYDSGCESLVRALWSVAHCEQKAHDEESKVDV